MASKVLLRAASTATQSTKVVGDISSVFVSLSGQRQDPLPPRFGDLKQNLIKGRQDDLHHSWYRLLNTLRSEIEEIKAKGSKVRLASCYRSLP